MVKNLKSVFDKRRVLVTGHTGFKGSWLTLLLNQMGASVCGIALPPEVKNCHFELLKIQNCIDHREANINDPEIVDKIVSDFKPEIIFHLAAQPLVRLSYDEPFNTFQTNVLGSVNVLEACRKHSSVRALIFVTSDKCYRNNEWIWGYRENDELGGIDPYSASKAAAEVVFSSYCQSFFGKRDGFGAASVRAGNVIGGGDWAKDRIIPDCVRALLQSNDILIRNPNSVRPWQHVLDPIYGYITLAARLLEAPKQYTGAWNFGPKTDSVKTVSDLVEMAIKVWGSGTVSIVQQMEAVHEARLLHLNCDKANQELQWYPRWDAGTAIAETIKWYRSVMLDGFNAMDVSVGQIRKFLN
jgi:CDP-glucose 4,6-dehydratase